MLSCVVEWDRGKQRGNLRKHGIEFTDAVAVLEDLAALTIEDTDHDEQRFVTLGMDAKSRVLVVVYSYPGPNRIRSALFWRARPTATNADTIQVET